jgi:hypothetical protein
VSAAIASPSLEPFQKLSVTPWQFFINWSNIGWRGTLAFGLAVESLG